MKYHKLRIAWSVACGILCLLLIALWVRSYKWEDHIGVQLPKRWLLIANSMIGTVHVSIHSNMDAARTTFSQQAPSGQRRARLESLQNPLGFGLMRDFGFLVIVPYWSLLAFAILSAASPWLRWRFSLRTLLIGMTAVAVALGLIIALSG